MAEKTSLLVLRLEGVLQSWGEGTKWDARDSASMPTKSGIVGLLACAMGLEREDPDIAALSDSISVTVRADRRGKKIEDFQTITGNPLRNAEGKPRSGNNNTVISKRTYLQDASFLVVIATSQAWHDRVVMALKNPKWSVCLGRRSCVPSRPVLECVQPKQTDPLKLIRTYPAAERASYPMEYETDIFVENRATCTRPDAVKSGYRRFARRRVWRGMIEEVADVSDEN